MNSDISFARWITDNFGSYINKDNSGTIMISVPNSDHKMIVINCINCGAPCSYKCSYCGTINNK